MSPSIRFFAASCVVVVILLATGCGADTTTVTGTVTYQNKPVTSGSVLIYCPDKQIVRGNLGPDGTYSIPNVPYGQAVVTVQAQPKSPMGLRTPQHLPPFSTGTPIPPSIESSRSDAQATRGVVIPPRYALPEESGLSVLIDRKHVLFNIDLKP